MLPVLALPLVWGCRTACPPFLELSADGVLISHCLLGFWVLNALLLFHLWQFTSGERRRLRPGLSISVFVSIRISSSGMTSGALSSCISNGGTSRYFHDWLMRNSQLHLHDLLCWMCLEVVCPLFILGSLQPHFVFSPFQVTWFLIAGR